MSHAVSSISRHDGSTVCRIHKSKEAMSKISTWINLVQIHSTYIEWGR